jgi:hypothetical protein
MLKAGVAVPLTDQVSLTADNSYLHVTGLDEVISDFGFADHGRGFRVACPVGGRKIRFLIWLAVGDLPGSSHLCPGHFNPGSRGSLAPPRAGLASSLGASLCYGML